MNDSRIEEATTEDPLSVVATTFATIGQGTLSDRTYAALRQSILSGDLPARTRVRETDLAAVVPVSRTPIREALFRLRDEGLLHVNGSRVLEVRELDLRESLQCYEILEALEPLAAELAAPSVSEAFIRELRDNVDLTEFFAQRGRWDDVTRESLRFHGLIYEACGNDRLIQVIRRLREETHRFRRFWTRDPALVEQSLEEDRRIIDALERRDPVEAARVMRVHLRASTDRIRAAIEREAAEQDAG